MNSDGSKSWVRNLVISLYAIAIDPRNPNVLAVVGSDQYTRLYDICKYKCDGSTDFGRPIDCFYHPHVIVNTNDTFRKTFLAFQDQMKQMEILLLKFIKDMGKKGVDSLSFFGLKSEYLVSGSGSGRVYIWKKIGGGLVRAKKEHVLGVDCTESHSHTTILASSGADGIKIRTPNDIDKTKLLATKTKQDQHVYLVLRSFINSLWSPYLDAIGSTAGQNSGMWMRFDTIDPEYVFFLSTKSSPPFFFQM
ncbi:hypothetical protein V6N13_055836 [Hibiscus sabdariffa]